MRALRRALALILILAALAVPGAMAADDESEPSPAPEASGTVQPAGEAPACDHPGWTDGVCVACGTPCAHEEHDYDSCVCFTCGQTVGHNYTTSKCPMCGRVPAFTDTAVEKSFFTSSSRPGTLETITYQTHDYVYERLGYGYEPFYKNMTVYLPYGYDSSKQYNVLILLHGTNGNETYWFGDNLVYTTYGADFYVHTNRMVDNLIASGMAREMIIVTPTFYRFSNDYSRYTREKDEEQFTRELREDILPAIIERYSTYAADGSIESVTAARDHFAYAGLSMGSIYAYNSIMPLCLDCFAWFGCFSGSDCYVDLAVDALNSDANSAYPIRYFYNSIGTSDSMSKLHRAQFIELTDRVDGLTDGENAWFTQIPGAGHAYSAWIVGLYNFLQVAFAM